jgi:hypothetical protein
MANVLALCCNTAPACITSCLASWLFFSFLLKQVQLPPQHLTTSSDPAQMQASCTQLNTQCAFKGVLRECCRCKAHTPQSPSHEHTVQQQQQHSDRCSKTAYATMGHFVCTSSRAMLNTGQEEVVTTSFLHNLSIRTNRQRQLTGPLPFDLLCAEGLASSTMWL